MENGVGKLAACMAPNVSPGKRVWRTPIPHFVPVEPKGAAGTFVFAKGGRQESAEDREIGIAYGEELICDWRDAWLQIECRPGNEKGF